MSQASALDPVLRGRLVAATGRLENASADDRDGAVTEFLKTLMEISEHHLKAHPVGGKKGGRDIQKEETEKQHYDRVLADLGSTFGIKKGND